MHNSPSQSRHKRAAGDDWSTGHLAAALAVGLAIGLGLGLFLGGRSATQTGNTLNTAGSPVTPVPVGAPPSPASTTTTPQPASGPLDAFGRPPSDPHYGHNHP